MNDTTPDGRQSTDSFDYLFAAVAELGQAVFPPHEFSDPRRRSPQCKRFLRRFERARRLRLIEQGIEPGVHHD